MSNTETELQELVNNVCRVAEDYGMEINVKKTKVMSQER